MCLLGVALATLNVFSTKRDLALATGPQSEDQRAWMIDASERPDIASFFKGLPHAKRLAMAEAIGRYDDEPLAKLVGKLLADFDADARRILTRSLVKIAAAHPDAVAAQMTQKGSFQILGIGEALRPLGPRALPAVADMLVNGDARPAASAYLVRAGQPAVATLLAKLDDPVADVQLAAANALGQIRAQEAVAPLQRKLQQATDAQRPAFLAALAAVGDPSTETLLSSTLSDSSLPLSERVPAAMGLGRIGTVSASKLLWKFASSDEPSLSSGALSALSTIGPLALNVPGTPADLRLKVAASVSGSEGDRVIREALLSATNRWDAVEAADDRPSLTGDLAELLRTSREDGALVERLVAALSSSEHGRLLLKPYANDPQVAGFIERTQGHPKA